MQVSKGIATAFVAGLVVAGGAGFWLRAHDEAAHAQEQARVAELDAQIERLERAMSRLSDLVPAGTPGVAAPATESQAEALPSTPAASNDAKVRDADQARAIAAADALVDRGIQSGQWTHEQAIELSIATADLDVKEQGRIQARVWAAVNAGKLQVELP